MNGIHDMGGMEVRASRRNQRATVPRQVKGARSRSTAP